MYARLDPVPPESLFDAIQRWLMAAPTRLLRVLCCAGLLGALGVMTIDQAQWPLALGMIAMAAGGEWGLLEHRLARSYSRQLIAAEVIVATVTLVATLVTIFLALFLFLGPAPHF